MPTVTETKSRKAGFVQQLLWQEKDGLIVVTPRDQDRFGVRLHRALEALKMVKKAEEFEEQFRLLLRIIAEWIKVTPGVSRAFITLRDGGLSLVVVRDSVKYDSAFEDALSELDLEIANDEDLALVRMSSIALPCASDEAIASFLNPEFSYEYIHGAGGGSHSSGKQES